MKYIVTTLLLLLVLFHLKAQTNVTYLPELWGITSNGGLYDDGVIYKITPNGTVSGFQKVFDFQSTISGSTSPGSLLKASNGKLYGMTRYGGLYNNGVIFSYDPSNSTNAFVKLHDFNLTITGSEPMGSLIQSLDGKLYGLTNRGGKINSSQKRGGGVIFSFDITNNIFSKLYEFDWDTGLYPNGSLYEASNGLLYGTCQAGSDCGNGVVFNFNKATNSFSVSYKFGCYLQFYLPLGSLNEIQTGLLYGSAAGSGGLDHKGGIFSLNIQNNQFSALKFFNYSVPGVAGYPWGDLIKATDGKIYGLTADGGVGSASPPVLGPSGGAGTLFSINLDGGNYVQEDIFGELDIYGNAKGHDPLGTLMQASDNNLYGVVNDGGGIFTFSLTDRKIITIHEFENITGDRPYFSKLIEYRKVIISSNPTLDIFKPSLSQINAITIYPNPSTGTFTIESALPIKEQIVVFNIFGVAVQTISSKGESTIKVSGLTTGMYLVQIGSYKQNVLVE